MIKCVECRPLRNHPYSQCHVNTFEDGTIQFVSYRTIVCEISPDLELSCFGTYSQTTRRQIGWFLREYMPAACYQTAKFCYENGRKWNPYHGFIPTED